MVTIEVVTLAGETVLHQGGDEEPERDAAARSTTVGHRDRRPRPPTATADDATDRPERRPDRQRDDDRRSTTASPITFTLDGHDPEGGALTATVTSIPAGLVGVGQRHLRHAHRLRHAGHGGPAVSGDRSPRGRARRSPTSPSNLIATPTSSTSTTTTTTDHDDHDDDHHDDPAVRRRIDHGQPQPGSAPEQRHIQAQEGRRRSRSAGCRATASGSPSSTTRAHRTTSGCANFGTSAPYTITLEGHPHGTELWVDRHACALRQGRIQHACSRRPTWW